MSQTIQIQALTPVDKWPARKLPQERFDTAVKRSMDQMSGMVGQLNDEFIPAVNSISPGVDTVVNNLSAIQAAPGHAASAAQSAMDATQKAGEAAGSATAAQAAQAAAETALDGAETARDEAETAKTAAEAARDAALAIAGIALSAAVPIAASGTGSAGVAGAVSRADHTHPNFLERAADLGDLSGDITLDMAAGRCFAGTVIDAVTIAAPDAGEGVCLLLALQDGGRHAVTWGMPPRWAGGMAPTLTAGGADVIALTRGPGNVWYGVHVAADARA